jgi:rubredoxin
MWKPSFKPEYIDPKGKPRVPEGKRFADIMQGLTCPRCKATTKVQAKPGRLENRIPTLILTYLTLDPQQLRVI